MATSTKQARLLNILAYVAVIAVGLALALAYLFAKLEVGDGNLIGALYTIAQALAYIVVACYSFFYARAKGTWWLVIWAIAVVLIVVFMIL